MIAWRKGGLGLLMLVACKGEGADGSGDDADTGSDTDGETGGACPDCGAVEWVVDLAATNGVSARDVQVHGDGSVVVVGTFNESLDVAGELLESAGGFDGFVAKLSPTGKLAWAHRFGDVGNDGASGVGLDADGNVYVFGGLEGEVDLGDGPVPNPEALTGWIASYDPSGAHRFSRLLAPGGTVFAIGLDARADGSFAISGYYDGTPDFGDGALAAADNRDAFVASFGPDGSTRWARGYGSGGGQSLDYGAGVAVDADGRVYLALGVQGALDLGAGPINAADDGDGVLIALDGDGNLQASQLLAGDGRDGIAGVAVSATGAVLVTGEVQAMGADLGDGMPQPTGGIYAAAFDADATHVWSRVFGPGLNRPWGIAGAGAGDVVIGAQFDGPADFGGGPLPDSGDADVVVARYASDGTHRWSRAFSGMEDAFASAVAGSPDDGVVAVGDYNGTIDFDGTLLTAGGRSGFVVKLSP